MSIELGMILKTISRTELEIKLDNEDYTKAIEYRWRNRFKGDRYEIYTYINGRKVTLRNFLFNPKPNEVKIHLNEDYLDYRRSNIQFISRKELAHLKGGNRLVKSSRYRNVYFCNTTKKWWVRLIDEGILIKEHCYENEYSATIAADYHSIRLYSGQANRNFPEMSDEDVESTYNEIRAKYGATRQEIKSKAQQGISRKKNTASKYVGVTYDKRPNRKKRWVAKIKQDGKTIHLGSYVSEAEAAKAYDAKAVELYGEHAKTNFDIDTKGEF